MIVSYESLDEVMGALLVVTALLMLIVKRIAKLSWISYAIATVIMTGVLAFAFREKLVWIASVLDSIKSFFG